GLEVLRRVGLLRVARDVDAAEEVAGGGAPMDRADDLVRGGVGLGVDGTGDELADRLAAADGHAAELEMGTLRQPDFDFETAIVAAGDDGEQLRPGSFAQGQPNPVKLGLATADDQALCARLAGRQLDFLP